MAMEMRARCGVAALPPMDEAALGGPESVDQSRALLHVDAQAEEIGHEKEYLVGRLATSMRVRRLRRFYFLLAGRYLSKFHA